MSLLALFLTLEPASRRLDAKLATFFLAPCLEVQRVSPPSLLLLFEMNRATEHPSRNQDGR